MLPQSIFLNWTKFEQKRRVRASTTLSATGRERKSYLRRVALLVVTLHVVTVHLCHGLLFVKLSVCCCCCCSSDQSQHIITPCIPAKLLTKTAYKPIKATMKKKKSCRIIHGQILSTISQPDTLQRSWSLSRIKLLRFSRPASHASACFLCISAVFLVFLCQENLPCYARCALQPHNFFGLISSVWPTPSGKLSKIPTLKGESCNRDSCRDPPKKNKQT